MANLIKSDLLRILKDKLFLVVSVIAVAFAIITPLMNYGLLWLFDLIGEEGLGLMLFNAKTMFFSAFLPGNNVGLILPILVLAILCKDFNHGTIRNKIINGETRTKIFFSMYISCATVITGIILAYAFLTLGVSLTLVEYQATPFTAADFGYLVLSVLFEILVYLAISAIACFICVLTRNTGLCIVLYIGASLFFSIVGSIVQVVVIFATPGDSAYWLVEFLNYANIFTSTLIGSADSYSFKEVVYAVLPSILQIGTFLGLGILTFSKKDLK